jgi:hypothetical protein
MSDTMAAGIVAGIIGVTGALAGVWMGFGLQQGAESRRYLRDGCATLSATILEHVALFEKFGPAARDHWRPEYEPARMEALTRVGMISRTLKVAAAQLARTALAAEEVAAPKWRRGDVQLRYRAEVVAAIELFEAAVRHETRSLWQRITRRP